VKRLALTVLAADGASRHARVEVRRLLLAGYTGRDREKVLAHVEELAALGVAPPERVPAVYVVAPDLLTTEPAITVRGRHTSGEAEFFLVPSPDGLLVGVGSDHTDRVHEAVDVTEAKARCPKPISQAVWRYEDVRDHWDRLRLRSWVTTALPSTSDPTRSPEPNRPGHRLYQEGPLAALLGVDALLAELGAAGYDATPGHLMFGGTLPTIGGLIFGHHFEVELADPVLDRRLTCAYDIVERG
jgi:hypothetical protein